MQWIVQSGDILKLPADVLICSANVFLNLSGGVGGEILLRFGDGMQRELHEYVKQRGGRRHVEQGDVVQTGPHGLPVRAVLHAVAVNGFYESSPRVVENVVSRALGMARTLGARDVSLTALATGFGRLKMREFAEGIKPLAHASFDPVERVIVCVRKESERDEIAAALV
jgi:O-acetyl-ADP-ribose deacetylase (regulator of RNase III)